VTPQVIKRNAAGVDWEAIIILLLVRAARAC
jgi:hypothetical protein